jgi:GNAT superfamily N-acetyltransferase
VNVESLTPERHAAAATVLADAFMDDPAWASVCPRGDRARRRFIRRTCLGTIKVSERWCGPSWCVVEDDELLAVLTGCAPGLWPPPYVRTLLMLLPGPALAGPRTLTRSLGANRIYDEQHPEHDHFLVWMLGVSPSHQREGLGRRLMTKALEQADEAEVPAYLWTGKPDNVPYYRSYGFEVFAEEPIPGGAPNWFMERPVPPPAP